MMKQLSAALMILMMTAWGTSQSASVQTQAPGVDTKQTAKQTSSETNGAKSSDTAQGETQGKEAAQKSTGSTGSAAPSRVPIEPAASGEPHTEMLDTANSPGGHDPLLEPRPLPRANLSLIGGLVRKVDSVRNRITVEPFGGGNKYQIFFDERTRILSNGRETTVLAIRPGSRVYVDTQALGAQVFAKTIQVRGTNRGPAQASGQVIEYLGGQVRLQDRFSGEPIQFVVTEKTKVISRNGESSAADLHSGSLIDVTFTPGEKRSEAQTITIHATPGGSYVFAGVLTHVDVRDGVLALDNQEDGQNYELYFDPLTEKTAARLTVGTPVSVQATFDGRRYRANSIKVTEGSANLESGSR